MVTIKSFTSLEQSQRLAEILNHESADMFYADLLDDNKHKYNVHILESYGLKTFEDTKTRESKRLSFLPCWSLSALLNVMPKDKSIDCAISFGYYNGEGEYIEKWFCSFVKEGETTDDFIIETTDGDNAIDACVEMILKLHERNLL
jgi:hypothetical protein